MTSTNDSAGMAEAGSPSLARVEVIRHSLGCFVWGWLGLVPWLGLPFAYLAWVQSSRARRGEQVTWNPAKPYRVAGMVLARIGVFLTILSLALTVLGAYWNSR